jgi:L-ascorbate metabolism protein UlaG (beta-lactamase superfamily)
MNNALKFRWLGVAGIEIRTSSHVLAIDPFFTRPPAIRFLAARRVHPNRTLIQKMMPECDLLLVTHPHYDHVMDVPEIALHTGAMVYGSQNTCSIMTICGVPAHQIHEVQAGDQINLGPFNIRVFPGAHMRIPFERQFNGLLPKKLSPPLRLNDYRMDAIYSFQVEVYGIQFLTGCYPVESDVFFSIPLNRELSYEELLPEINPRLVVPIHWDQMFRSVTSPIYTMLVPPKNKFGVPRRLDLRSFCNQIKQTHPGGRILVPEVLREYDLKDVLNPQRD